MDTKNYIEVAVGTQDYRWFECQAVTQYNASDLLDETKIIEALRQDGGDLPEDVSFLHLLYIEELEEY